MSVWTDRIDSILSSHFHDAGLISDAIDDGTKNFIYGSLLSILSERYDLATEKSDFNMTDVYWDDGFLDIGEPDAISILRVEYAADDVLFDNVLEAVSFNNLSDLSPTWQTDRSADPSHYAILGTPGSTYFKLKIHPSPIDGMAGTLRVTYTANASSYFPPLWIDSMVILPYIKAILAEEKTEFDRHWGTFLANLNDGKAKISYNSDPHKGF
jgi:hypothetical protein